MDNIINSIITIISVLIGGFITYGIGQKEIKRNVKLEVYLEFLNKADGRYDMERTAEYFDIIRKLYLVANDKVLEALIQGGYIPSLEKSNFLHHKDPIDNPLGYIVIAMRKDIGIHNRKLKKYEFINWYFRNE